VLSFVKDESNNLSTMATSFCYIINDVEPLSLLRVSKNTWFGHVLLKTCWYVTNDNMDSMGIKQWSLQT
jgi:hypothetical protein